MKQTTINQILNKTRLAACLGVTLTAADMVRAYCKWGWGKKTPVTYIPRTLIELGIGFYLADLVDEYMLKPVFDEFVKVSPEVTEQINDIVETVDEDLDAEETLKDILEEN